MAETSDAIIIGAGIHGASLAFHLTRRGLRPIILERRFVASSATGRSSGLVRMHYDLEPEAALAWASYRVFRDWSEIVGGECGFTRTGFLQIVAPDHNDRLRANVAMHQRLGIPSLVVGADDVRRLAPAIVADLSPIELRGLFQGVCGAAWGLSAFIGPLLGSWVYQNLGPQALWYGCFLLGLLLAAGYLGLGRRAQAHPTSA